METWGNLIKSSENQSPLRHKEFLDALADPLNVNSSNFQDF